MTKIKGTMILRSLAAFAFALLLPRAVLADDYDGSKTLLCAVGYGVSCAGAGECERATTRELDVAPYIKIDFGTKQLTGKLEGGENRKSPIRHVQSDEYGTVVQGGEYGRGWSFVVQHDTGNLSGAIAGFEGAIVLFGTCRVD